MEKLNNLYVRPMDVATKSQPLTTESKKQTKLPWLVGLSGLSAGLRNERLWVQFPVRAHVWVVGQDPSWGRVRGNQLMHLSCTYASFPLFLPLFLSL